MSDLVFRAFFYVETKGDESVNILHLKYAVSIADNGSINKAAEEIHVAQPNLSRVIKELEADLGITIFQRSAHGMILTPEGASAFPSPPRGPATSPTLLPIFPGH